MSWSISASGTPDEVIERLSNAVNGLSGQSRIEYEEALPHLTGLVRQNFSEPPGQLALSASGSGSVANGRQVQRSCNVILRQV